MCLWQSPQVVERHGIEMEIRVLRYFLTVVREQGINRAAEVLHITQPTLSRQLLQLEEEVGVKLFHRGARKITLTNEGILLRRRAEEIEKGLVDIGLLLEPVDIEKFDFIRLGQKERWVVLMRPDSPLARKEVICAQDLTGVSLILPRRLNVQNELSNWFGELFQDVQILFTSNLSTNSAMPFWDKEKMVYRPLEPELTASCVLAWKKQQPLSLAVSKFLEHIKCFLSISDI